MDSIIADFYKQTGHRSGGVHTTRSLHMQLMGNSQPSPLGSVCKCSQLGKNLLLEAMLTCNSLLRV